MKNTTDFKKIIREYYEQLYVNTFENADEMDKFFEKHVIIKAHSRTSRYLNNPIFIKEIEFVTRTPFHKINTRFRWLHGYILQKLKKERIFILHEFLQKTEEGTLLPHSLRQAL